MLICCPLQLNTANAQVVTGIPYMRTMGLTSFQIALLLILSLLTDRSIFAANDNVEIQQKAKQEMSLVLNKAVLSLNVVNIPLRDLMQELARQQGVQADVIIYILDAPGMQAPRTLQFSDLPLEEGLRRLLEGVNYTMIYNAIPSQGKASVRADPLGIRVLEPGTAQLHTDERLTAALFDALRSRDARTREKALWIFDYEESLGLVPTEILAEIAIRDSSPELRYHAMRRLAERAREADDNSEIMEVLERGFSSASKDPDWQFRLASLEIVKEMIEITTSGRQLTDWTGILADMAVTDLNPEVRARAIEVSGEIHEIYPSGQGQYLLVLKSGLRDSSPEVRMAALNTLEDIEEDTAPGLIGKLAPKVIELARADKHPEVRSSALGVLSVILDSANEQTADLTNVLRDGIKDPNPEIRSAVLNLLEEMGEQAPVAPLAEMALNDPSPGLRYAAVDALAGTGKKEVLPTLEKATTDSNPRISNRAKELIRTMQVKE